ncbi:MAG TPA: ABC transporter transmembrane domain-containing protein, partial [Tabrizicola sp.]|nr:ABC transporter transmembrane domain-containing protein [Tabrizicola sp.]
MIATYRKLFSLLDPVERRRFWILTLVLVAVAAVEIVGMSAVLMLLNVLSAPDMVQTQPVLKRIYDTLGFESTFTFQVTLAAAVMAVVVGGLVVKAVGAYATTRFSMMRGYTVSTRLLSAYLSQPYPWFLNRNSAELGKNVLAEVDGLVNRVFLPCLKLVANALLVAAILGFLMLVDPLVTLFSGGVLGLGYALIYLRFRARLQTLGEEMMNSYRARFVVAQEATGGIKDIKLMGLEATYVRNFGTASRNTAQTQATVGILQDLPRYLLEALTFGTMLALVLILLVKSGGNITQIVPTLGVIAFSTMRLLPALQQIYHGLAALRSATSILDTIVADMAATPLQTITDPATERPLPLENALELTDISFAYSESDRPTLRGVDLVIPARTTVGIVGGTGAGKTTLVDLILGLLPPAEGEMRVDGTPI